MVPEAAFLYNKLAGLEMASMTGAPAGPPSEVVRVPTGHAYGRGYRRLQGEPRQPEILQEPVDRPYGVRDPSSNHPRLSQPLATQE